MVNYQNASLALNSAGIDLASDFFTLSFCQVSALVDLAKIQGYRKPKNANGSTARYYFAALQRAARKEGF